MIKLFTLKQQKKDEESAGGNRTGAGGKKASAAQLRIQKGRLVAAAASWLVSCAGLSGTMFIPQKEFQYCPNLY